MAEKEKREGRGVLAVLLIGGAAAAAAVALYLATRAKAAPIPPKDIVLSDLVIEPSEVYVGEPVSIFVTATNIGGVTGSYQVTCEVV